MNAMNRARLVGITRLEADAIVNAADTSLHVDEVLRGHETVLGFYHACGFFERLTVLEYKAGCD